MHPIFNNHSRDKQMRLIGRHWQLKCFKRLLEVSNFNYLIMIALYGLLNVCEPDKAVNRWYFGFKKRRYIQEHMPVVIAKIFKMQISKKRDKKVLVKLLYKVK